MRILTALIVLLATAFVPAGAWAQNGGTAETGIKRTSGADLGWTASYSADAATRQLVQSRKRGSGRMIVEIERNSELARLFRAKLTSNPEQVPIPKVLLEFFDDFVINGNNSKDGNDTSVTRGSTKATLTNVTVLGITPSKKRDTFGEVGLVFHTIDWI